MSVKVGVISDVHSEFYQEHILKRITDTLADADLILMAGDIGNGVHAIHAARKMFSDKPICMVAGNHEFYHGEYHSILAALRHEAHLMDVSFLQQDDHRLVIHDCHVRILGVTYWTDLNLYGNTPIAALDASRGLNDFRLIEYENRRLTPADTLKLHESDRQWLTQALAEPFDGTTIVMTHHAPVSFAISQRFCNDKLSPCFASRGEQLFLDSKPDLVVWGHTHHCVDRTIDGVRFVSCQSGYPVGLGSESNRYGQIVEL